MKPKYNILILIYFFHVETVFANSIDSSVFKRLHVGIGYFSGVQSLFFDYFGELYYHFGFDAGILAKVGYDVSTKYAAYAQYRLRDNNASVLYAGYSTELYSIANQLGVEVQRTFFNRLDKNLLTVIGGLNYVWSNNTLTYSIDPRFLPPYPPFSTVETIYVNEPFYQKFFTVNLGVSKCVPLWSRLNLNFFAEIEYGLNNLNFNDLKYMRPYPPDLVPEYRPFIWRLGFCVLY